MQVKNIVVALLLIFTGIINLSAQELKLASEAYPEHRYYPLRGEAFFSAYRQIKGSAYLTDDWVKGDVWLTEGDILKNVQYKFDVYAHRLLVYNDYLKRVIILEKDHVRQFTFKMADGKERIFRKIEADHPLRLTSKEYFQEIIEEGTVSVYKLYFRDISPLRTPEMPFIDEFVNGVHYYCVYQNKWELAKLHRSYLYKKFPTHKIELRQFIRDHKLKAKDDDDLKEIMNYLNQIIALDATL
jgi:hypothetical protein